MQVFFFFFLISFCRAAVSHHSYWYIFWMSQVAWWGLLMLLQFSRFDFCCRAERLMWLWCQRSDATDMASWVLSQIQEGWMWPYLGLAGMHHVTSVSCSVHVAFAMQLGFVHIDVAVQPGLVCWCHSAAWKSSDCQAELCIPSVEQQTRDVICIYKKDEPLDWWRRGLVIVGSPETLKANSNWLEWLEWVRSQNAILHSDDLA